MPTITTDTPILDSGGKQAEGFVTCRVTEGYVSPVGELTRTGYRAVIKGGHLLQEDGISPLVLQYTPPGYHMHFSFDIFETRDGVPTKAPLQARVRDIPDLETVEWVDLPVSDGYGPEGYVEIWYVNPEDPIPAEAKDGQMYVYPNGDYGRYKDS
jgi:hypothetical protein